MAEVSIEVKPILKKYICDSCGIGEMRPTWVTLMSSPPQYPHRCTECPAEKIFWKQYPFVDFIEVPAREG